MDLYLGFLRVAAFLQAIETRRMACLERIGMNRSRADVPIGMLVRLQPALSRVLFLGVQPTVHLQR